MTDELDRKPQAEEATDITGTPAAGSSMMAALRAKHDQIARSTTIDLDLPGYGGLLVVRYHALDVQNDINKIGTRVSKEFNTPAEQGLYGSIDTMIAACDGLYVRRDMSNPDQLESIGDDPIFADVGNPVVKFDHNLAKFMGFEGIAGARDVVLAMFDNTETMILVHGQDLSRWMADVTKRTQATFAGNL
jgi:hypothetical protein